MRMFECIDALIGHTPLVRLRQLSDETGVLCCAKLESFNPGGSVKDRLGLALVLDAEKRGRIRKGSTIVEPTSGNTGIGVAMVAVHRGYRVILTMPDTASLERRILFEAFGAELLLTPGRLGMLGAIQRAEEVVRDTPGAVTLRQFDNLANVEIHRDTTGPEIWEDTDGQVSMVVSGIGTGGTISGVGEYLKSRNPLIRIVGVEPKESSVLLGGEPGPHKIQGIGPGFVPSILNQSVIDLVMPVSQDDAMSEARSLAATEGILCGISGGAALVAARQALAQTKAPDGPVVVVLPDSGERYLSTALYRKEPGQHV